MISEGRTHVPYFISLSANQSRHVGKTIVTVVEPTPVNFISLSLFPFDKWVKCSQRKIWSVFLTTTYGKSKTINEMYNCLLVRSITNWTVVLLLINKLRLPSSFLIIRYSGLNKDQLTYRSHRSHRRELKISEHKEVKENVNAFEGSGNNRVV